MGNSTINSGTSGSTQYAEHPVTTQPTTGNPPQSTSTPQPATVATAPPNASKSTIPEGGATPPAAPPAGASGSETPNTASSGTPGSSNQASESSQAGSQDSYMPADNAGSTQSTFEALLGGAFGIAHELTADASGSSTDALPETPATTFTAVMHEVAESNANTPAVMTASSSGSSSSNNYNSEKKADNNKQPANKKRQNGNVNPNEAQASRSRTLGASRTPSTQTRSASPQSVWTPVAKQAANTAKPNAQSQVPDKSDSSASEAHHATAEKPVVVSKNKLELQEKLAKQALAKQTAGEAGADAQAAGGAVGTEGAEQTGQTGDKRDSTTTKNKKADQASKNNAPAKPDSPLAKLVAETTAGLLKSMQNVAENAPRIVAQMMSAALAVVPSLANNQAKDSDDRLSLTGLCGIFEPQGSSATQSAGSAFNMIIGGLVCGLEQSARKAGFTTDAMLSAAREFGKFSGVGYSAVQKHALGEASSEDGAHASSDSSSRAAAVASNSPRAYDPLKPEQLEILNRGGTPLDMSGVGGPDDPLTIYMDYPNTKIPETKPGTGLKIKQSFGHTNDRLQGPLASV